jgi:hypothetical protein
MAKQRHRPPIHCTIYGDTGSRKSTFAGTFPKPIAVNCFDPHGKDTPYLRLGVPTELEIDDRFGTYFREVYSKQGEVIVRLDYFIDADPKRPTAYRSFLSRMQAFHDEYDQWKTIVNDSVTFMEFICRKNEQYHLNPTAKDARQWWGGSTNELEEMLLGTFGALPLNVVNICHIDEDKDEFNGVISRKPKAPGRLGKGIAAGYGEMYHAYVARATPQSEREWLLQTQPDAMWMASTQIGAPDPCAPHYEALWENWK